MVVNILNKFEVRELFKNWGEFSCTCYNTPKKYAENVGKSCLKTKHFSGSRAEYIKFEISGVSRACIDQMIRAEQGAVKNVMSGRYVDFSHFDYHTPVIIENDPILKKIYDEQMESARIAYGAIVVRLNCLGYEGEKAFEIARGVAPMNHHSAVTIGFTIEGLINFMHKRLCTCSQDEIRKLANAMRHAVVNVIPELDEYLVPACDAYGFCPEQPKRSCKKYPQREVAQKLMDEYKKNTHFREMIDRKEL